MPARQRQRTSFSAVRSSHPSPPGWVRTHHVRHRLVGLRSFRPGGTLNAMVIDRPVPLHTEPEFFPSRRRWFSFNSTPLTTFADVRRPRQKFFLSDKEACSSSVQQQVQAGQCEATAATAHSVGNNRGSTSNREAFHTQHFPVVRQRIFGNNFPCFRRLNNVTPGRRAAWTVSIFAHHRFPRYHPAFFELRDVPAFRPSPSFRPPGSTAGVFRSTSPSGTQCPPNPECPQIVNQPHYRL